MILDTKYLIHNTNDMRVIAGYLKGRILHEPHGHRTHPMSEKIRGAIFNALGDIEGLSLLDAFAGSGAVSAEAVSRGAKFVQAVDQDKEAVRCIRKNIDELKLSSVIKLSQANISSWLDTNPDATFGVVILDPPYDDVRPELLEKIANFVKISGIVVLSLPSDTNFELSPTTYHLLSTKLYGDARLDFYRRVG
jgi:16S rRNA (guanine966-N2)-methyltransferase